MLDSLVRVSRRVDENHLVRIVIMHIHKDPKDSELCVHRVKPEEILVEARSDTDVQIVRQM